MAADYRNDHEHDLEPEYLHPSDADVLAIREEGRGVVVEFAAPCPECNESLKLTTSVDVVADVDLDLPLDDSWYD